VGGSARKQTLYLRPQNYLKIKLVISLN